MAKYYEPNRMQLKAWKKWVKSRPPKVRAVAERFEPWSLYRMKSTGTRVTLVSIQEPKESSAPVTMTVSVTGEFNVTTFDRQVFGIDPDDLEPCELPGPDEAVGALLADDEVEANLDALRVLVRPDLWAASEDGKAVRKA